MRWSPTRTGALDWSRVSWFIAFPGRVAQLGIVRRLHVPRPLYITLAFALAILATMVGWSQSLNYKITPTAPLAFWFPLIVITGAGDLAAVALSLVQFPLFALVFAFGIRRWPVRRVLVVILVAYALLAGISFAIVRSR